MFGVFIYKINPLTNQVFDLISTCENVLDFNLLALILNQSIYAVYTTTYSFAMEIDTNSSRSNKANIFTF